VGVLDFLRRLFPRTLGTPVFVAGPGPSPATELYDALAAYRDGNSVYERLLAGGYDQLGSDTTLPLRTVANRVTESYCTFLWPGTLPDALPIEAGETAFPGLVDAIAQIFTWSNWSSSKQVLARDLPTYGDAFLKAATRTDDAGVVKRVFMEVLRPQTVTDFATDERGYVTTCRIDVAVTVRVGGVDEQWTDTEVWDKAALRQWRHRGNAGTRLEDLGTPDVETPLSQWGIDFVPIVHIPHRDIGETRGAGAFTHALTKITEADRMATNLHRQLFRFNKPTWAVTANQIDGAGRPMPAPELADDGTTPIGTVSQADADIFYLPGMSKLESLVPNLNYAAALAILDAMMRELEADLPELALLRLHEMGGQLSARAAKLLLAPGIGRILETRGNGETGMIRGLQMALSIGGAAGLPGFPTPGAYEAGLLDFTFAARPVLPVDEFEVAQGVVLVADFLSEEEILRRLDYSIDDISRIMAEKEAQRKRDTPPALAVQPMPPGTVLPPGAQGRQGVAA